MTSNGAAWQHALCHNGCNKACAVYFKAEIAVPNLLAAAAGPGKLSTMEFINNDPAATVRGANIQATLDALHEAPAFSNRLIERHGLPRRSPDAEMFVPVQRWLNALREIQMHVGEPALRETGVRLVQNAEFPPTYLTVEAILLALNDIYYVNHRGDVGYYKAEQHHDGTVRISCATPYPRNFERGLIEGICRNRRAGGTIYCVEYQEGLPGSEFTCTLTVHRA